MTYEDRPTPVNRFRRIAVALVAGFVLAALVGGPAVAGGGKFTYVNKRDRAALLWQSFVDNEAYLTSTVTGRQRSGGRGMFMKVDHESLSCAGGGQSCVAIGGNGISLSEGAEFRSKNAQRFRPNLPKRYGLRKVLSTALDRRSSVMRAEHLLCVDRSIIPDTCSRPRLSNHPY